MKKEKDKTKGTAEKKKAPRRSAIPTHGTYVAVGHSEEAVESVAKNHNGFSRNPQLIIEDLKKESHRPTFFSIKQTSRILGLRYMQIYRLVVIGRLDASLVRGSWRLPCEGLIKYLEKHLIKE